MSHKCQNAKVSICDPLIMTAIRTDINALA